MNLNNIYIWYGGVPLLIPALLALHKPRLSPPSPIFHLLFTHAPSAHTYICIYTAVGKLYCIYIDIV